MTDKILMAFYVDRNNDTIMISTILNPNSKMYEVIERMYCEMDTTAKLINFEVRDAR